MSFSKELATDSSIQQNNTSVNESIITDVITATEAPIDTTTERVSRFDIRQHDHLLEPSDAGQDKRICPVCSKNDLSINVGSGAFTCYSGGCSGADIRKAVLKRAGELPEITPRKRNQPDLSLFANFTSGTAFDGHEPDEPEASADDDNTIRVGNLKHNTEEERRASGKAIGEYWRNSKRNALVERLLEGLKVIPDDWKLTPVKEKKAYHENWAKTIIPREHLEDAIKYGEVVRNSDGKEYPSCPTGYGILLGETSNNILAIDCDGVTAIDYLKSLLGSIPSTVRWTSGKEGRMQLLFKVPDEQLEGLRTTVLTTSKENKQQLEFRWTGSQSVLPPSVHPETQEYKWIANPQECEILPLPDPLLEKWRELLSVKTRETIKEEPDAPATEKPFIKSEYRIIHENVFGQDKWACLNGTFYKSNGVWYKRYDDPLVLKEISDFCQSYTVTSCTRDGETYLEAPFDKPHFVRNSLEYAKQRLARNPDNINSAGMLFTNGILVFDWTEKVPTWELRPHFENDDWIFTYEPQIKYDPQANDEYAKLALGCLTSEQQQIFLRLVGSAINLPECRKRRGREVRALFLVGQGSNGKDALKTLNELVFGSSGMTSKTTQNFADADTGKIERLAGLEHSRINHPSENKFPTRLDKMETLKAVITGDSLEGRYLHKDAFQFTPKCLCLFNSNAMPPLIGEMEALLSRLAFIRMEKTYVTGREPNPLLGEVKGDPRFKYDIDFLKEHVAPAYLNMLLKGLIDFCQEGIDYSCTEIFTSDLQKASSHLFEFTESVGLEYGAHTDFVSATEIFEKLKDYYLKEELLIKGTYGDLRWEDDPKPSDKLIKVARNIPARFLEIFPKAKQGKAQKANSSGNYPSGLYGLRFNPDSFKQKMERLYELKTETDATNTTNTSANVQDFNVKMGDIIWSSGDSSEQVPARVIGVEPDANLGCLKGDGSLVRVPDKSAVKLSQQEIEQQKINLENFALPEKGYWIEMQVRVPLQETTVKRQVMVTGYPTDGAWGYGYKIFKNDTARYIATPWRKLSVDECKQYGHTFNELK